MTFFGKFWNMGLSALQAGSSAFVLEHIKQRIERKAAIERTPYNRAHSCGPDAERFIFHLKLGFPNPN
jgi:hypothetical protein